MADKLEVLPGQGLVARFGEVAVWAGPQCSAALQSHLVTEAQRAAQALGGAEQMANSLISVLQRGDPEPHAPFAVVGPGTGGMTLLLHGPVQAWDSGRWLAPQPVPGWMTASIGRPWPLIVLAYGASPPPQSQQGNPFDLQAGVVPGSGFVMLRPPPAPAQGTATVGVAAPLAGTPAQGFAGGPGREAGGGAGGIFGNPPAAGPPTVEAPAAGPPTAGPGGAGIGTSGAGFETMPAPGGAGPAQPEGQVQVPQASTAPTGGAGSFGTGTAVASPPGGPFLAPGPAAPAPAAVLDLRNVLVPTSPPLPLASALATAGATARPEANGVFCDRGHFNHPGASRCGRCGRPLSPGGPAVSGPRPPLGALLADDGSIWALDQTYVVGSDPSSDAEVRMGAAGSIAMRSGANHQMAPVQAEVRVSGWNVYLVDRGADGGAYWQGPSSSGWVQLGRNEQRELTDGCHISCGGRVLTYLSAWAPAGPAPH